MNTERKGEGAMHIVERIRIDTAGRLLLTKVFREMPASVIISFDTRSKKLFFREAHEGEEKIARKTDGKNRVCLPKWVIEELGEEYYACEESLDEHFVLPRKFILDS